VAERVMLVCDACGQPAEETVTIRAGGKSMLKDLCAKHLGELLTGTRAPRRGRPRSRDKSTGTSSTVRARRTRQGAKASSARSKRSATKRTTKSVGSEKSRA
jgi:hypothetical protein